MNRPAWFPNWEHEIVAIIASGPSTKSVDLDLLRGKAKVIAIKENQGLVPWCDVTYGCDAAFWHNANGLHQYAGIRVCYDARIRTNYPGIYTIDIDKKQDTILFEPPGIVGSGGNSGFQALNLAVQFGARRIVLTGYDVDGSRGLHWYGHNNGPGRTNPNDDNFKRWRAAFEASASLLIEHEIEVINTSEPSALKCFPKESLESVLRRWS